MRNDDKDLRKEKRTDANRDPITGTPGAHPVGTGLGAAAGGAATGAAVGSVAGPVGTAAGIVGGAIVGGLAGKGVAEAVNPTAEDAYWREHHSRQWFGRNQPYEEYQGAYRTGYEGYSKYGSSRTFDQCDADLQRDYEKNRASSKLRWDDARDAARAAWHKVHGRWERVIDYDVEDQNGRKIGTVNNLWTDESGQPSFIGVKTGWLFGKNHVVPVHTATINERQRIVRLPFAEEKIKDAPSFDADCDLSDSDEERIYTYYNLQRGRQAPAMAARETQRAPTAATGKEQATIALSEEQLKVGKREVTVGGVRLRKIVRTEIVNQPVELKREEVVIERVPASAGQPTQAMFQGEDVFIPLRREEAVVEKQAQVREEVRVSKQATSEQQTVSEKVRKEDVEIEKEGEARFQSETGKPRQGAPRYEPKERGKR